ncbi:MAG: hypothetical protein IKO64_01060 [Kiritimatiellae bacterium]|nr:hypothetical protein [Kiritimatiellia bacterium]
MSLLNDATNSTELAKRLVIESDRQVNYAVRRIAGNWKYAQGVGIEATLTRAWSYSRYCTGSLRYIGLTRSAANTLAATLRSRYTRSCKISVFDGDTIGLTEHFSDIDGGDVSMASVEVRAAGGDAYDVILQLNEQDEKTRENHVSATSLFSTENNRTYPDFA